MSVAGVSHIPAQIRRYPPPWRWYWEQHVGSLDKDKLLLRSGSPVVLAGFIKAPVLLIHGASDATVLRLHSDLMASALRTHKQRVTYMVLPDEGHGFQDSVNWLRLAAATEEFLATVLGGRVEPPSPQEEFKSLLR